MARRRKSDEEEVSYWLSYSDMMAGLLLVFVLIISFTMLQSRIRYEEKTAEIERQQETIDSLLGVKSEIVEVLIKEFENSGLQINVDSKTGAIMFDSDLLFDPDSAVLKQSSKNFLDEFLPRYFSILLGDDYVDDIAEIIIEGHTAEFGTYMGCLLLSQERAFAVATYAANDNSILKEYIDIETLRDVLTVNGRAYYDPIYGDDGTYDMANSRRVEIKFRLRNEDIIDEILNSMS